MNITKCERKHPVDTNDKLQKHEAKKETIKAKVVIEEKKVLQIKEQKARIKKRLTVAKKGLILEVDSILNDTNNIKQVIEVINEQGMLISADSGIIALQETIIDNQKQIDSTNTNVIIEIKEQAKKDIKHAKRKGFWNGVKAVGVVGATILIVKGIITVL